MSIEARAARSARTAIARARRSKKTSTFPECQAPASSRYRARAVPRSGGGDGEDDAKPLKAFPSNSGDVCPPDPAARLKHLHYVIAFCSP